MEDLVNVDVVIVAVVVGGELQSLVQQADVVENGLRHARAERIVAGVLVRMPLQQQSLHHMPSVLLVRQLPRLCEQRSDLPQHDPVLW